MTTTLIAFNGTRENGQFLGDQLCSIKVAHLFAEHYPADKVMLALSPQNEMNFLWQKFIDDYKVEVVYDSWHPGNMEQRFAGWQQWFTERNIEGRPFDQYFELYRRIDGGRRQPILSGKGECGLNRKNIFQYFWFGQERAKELPPNIDEFGPFLIYHPVLHERIVERDVLIAPHAKCQGNNVFTFEYWSSVVRKLVDYGVSVTVNFDGHFCDELNGHSLFRKIFPDFKGLLDEVCRHRLVACGNTGVGWLAAACGVPLLAMQPENSNMADYRYELCGLNSLLEIMDQPNSDYCAEKIRDEVGRVLVMTTGCFDILHAGHVRHLEESRAMGTKLIVALNSDESVRSLKGQGRPVNNQNQRKAVLEALRSVDEVRVFDGDDASVLIEEVRPAVLTNGCDHSIDSIVGKSFVEGYGGKVVVTSGTRDQSSTKIIAQKALAIKPAEILKAIQDAGAVSVNPWAKLKLLADQYLSVVHLDGDVADVGAYRGGCSLILRRLGKHKHLHVFDTWNGNPHDDPLCHHKVGEWPAKLAECKAIVGEDERTHYYEGVFPHAIDQTFAGKNYCFVNIDPDAYQTVRDAIEFFWPRMVIGGKMIFDDYGWEPCSGVKKAVDEFFGVKKTAYDSIGVDQVTVCPEQFACVVTKK